MKLLLLTIIHSIIISCAQNPKVYTVKIVAHSKQERSLIANYYPIDQVEKDHVIVTVRDGQYCSLEKLFSGHYEIVSSNKNTEDCSE